MRTSRAKTFAILAVCFMALSVIPAGALPTPGLSGSASQTVLGRVFPEALQTNDYISYAEARAGLDILASAHSDVMKVIEVGPSVGWVNALGVSMPEPPDELESLPPQAASRAAPAAVAPTPARARRRLRRLPANCCQ